MRPVLLLALFVLLGFASPARAQAADDASLYQITDVLVDVTAANAAQARDQAIEQAQHAAFEQLLSRLGADIALSKQDNDVLAPLVQAFEVQKEQRSAVRYIGTFTVQFKPNAVRSFLDKSGTSFTEARSKPVVVLPVVSNAGHNTLWEDRTPWRAAWEDSVRNAGLVPLAVPAGDLDDIVMISTAEALGGKTESLQNIMRKYQAGQAVVVVLNGDPGHPNPQEGIRIDVRRYDSNGKTSEPEQHLTLPPTADVKVLASVLADGVKQVREGMETGWRQSAKAPKGPPMHLLMTAPFASLAAWTELKIKVAATPNVVRTNVIAITREAATIDLEFRGDIPQLQETLKQQGLTLEQPAEGESWQLRKSTTP